jgi:hypothetical protein
MQNTSHAVMSQRIEPIDSPDDFPTPPWATRALIEHIVGRDRVRDLTCLEPACGAGHMARPLKEYFSVVKCADAYDYGYAPVRDFLSYPYETNAVDWVITNPPFRLAEEFVLRSFDVARQGVAVLVRTVFLESVGRYNRLFCSDPPTIFAQFVERVPMVRGRLDEKATTATGYAWLVWEHDRRGSSELAWIPPCRRKLERHTDYERKQPASL